MTDKIDRRWISNDFLLMYFPSPQRYHELESKPPKSTLAISEERYLFFKKKLNEERKRSGKSPWSDSDITAFIKNAEGYLSLSKELRPNKDFSR